MDYSVGMSTLRFDGVMLDLVEVIEVYPDRVVIRTNGGLDPVTVPKRGKKSTMRTALGSNMLTVDGFFQPHPEGGFIAVPDEIAKGLDDGTLTIE